MITQEQFDSLQRNYKKLLQKFDSFKIKGDSLRNILEEKNYDVYCKGLEWRKEEDERKREYSKRFLGR